ncbi:MAG: tetratricopeptide repeat protein, partial [Deltaproteobacteria bacterium]
MKRLLIVFLSSFLILPFALPAYPQEDTKEAESLFVAQKAFDDGFYDVALSLLERFIKNYPASDKTSDVNLLIGRCYFQESRFLDALKQFEDLLEVPSARKIKDAVLFWIAEVHFRGNIFPKAAKYYKQIIDEFPHSPYTASAYYSLGWCLSQEGRYAEALENFKLLEQKFPGEQQSRDSAFKIIECLYNLKEYARLKERLKSCMKDCKDDPVKLSHLSYYLGEADYYLEDYSGAVEQYQRTDSLSQDPKIKTLARLGLAWSYVK